jgi:hypothetical protein
MGAASGQPAGPLAATSVLEVASLPEGRSSGAGEVGSSHGAALVDHEPRTVFRLSSAEGADFGPLPGPTSAGSEWAPRPGAPFGLEHVPACRPPPSAPTSGTIP